MSKARRAKARQAQDSEKLAPPPPWMKITDYVLANAGRRPDPSLMQNPFTVPTFPARSMRRVPREERLAMDQAVIEINAWAAQQMYNGAWFEGTAFLGYTYLSELSQRPEYRRMVEVVATEATRKWIELQSQGGEDKKDQINQLKEALEKLDVQGAFRRVIEIDGFFGRGHLYLDTGDTDDRKELVIPIGDGSDKTSGAKVSPQHPLLAVKPIEPVWCYPARYNATDPLKDDWYRPQTWFVQGKEIHSTRLLRFVGRDVPDLLKPAYAFGGLSLTQLAKPYVDNWLRGRQSISDLIWSYSTSGIKTSLGQSLGADGDQIFKRIEFYNRLKTNRSALVLDKETEEFFQFNTPLGTLDALQAQLQEHMCSVSGIPVVKLLGIQPAGLNASSQGELEVWYDWIEAYQEKIIRERLTRVINFVQLSLWGQVDPDITYKFVPLRADDPVQAAQVRKLDAETGAILVEGGAISQQEERSRVAKDPDSGYDGVDENELPVAPGLGGEDPDEVPPAEPPNPNSEVLTGDEWKEVDHPRGPDGRFGSGGAAYYHASANHFTEFDPTKVGSSTDPGHLGTGFYFSTDPNIGRNKEHKMEVRLHIKNPLDVQFKDWSDDKRGLVRAALGLPLDAPQEAVNKALKEKGHDAVVLNYGPVGYQHNEVMVPEANQIKYERHVK